MAVIFVEGFDAYNGGANTATAGGLFSRWIGTGAPGAGRFGGQSYYAGFTNFERGIIASLPGSYTTGTYGFAMLLSGVLSNVLNVAGIGTDILFDASLSVEAQIYLRVNADKTMSVLRGNTVLLTTTQQVLPGSWDYIELEFLIDPSVGFANLYINNSLAGSVTGVNTQNLATSAVTQVTLGTNSTLNTITDGVYYDDVYVTDTPSRLGEQRVLTTYVDADSTPSEWGTSTPSAAPYTMLDETLCDGDTTYIYSGTAGASAIFSTQNPSVVPTSVQAVQIGGFARKTDTGARGVQLQYVDGAGSTFNSSTFVLAGGPGYGRQLSLYNTNPGTGLAWTAAELNAMRIGVRVST